MKKTVGKSYFLKMEIDDIIANTLFNINPKIPANRDFTSFKEVVLLQVKIIGKYIIAEIIDKEQYEKIEYKFE